MVEHVVTDGSLDALQGEAVQVSEDAVTLAYTLDGVRYDVRLAVTGGQLHDGDGTAIVLGGE